MRHDGGLLIALGAGLGFLVSLWNYFVSPALLASTTDISHTWGALVAVAATLALLLAGLVLAGSARNPALVAFLVVGCLVGILGTALTAWLLESPLLLALMLVSGIGWVMRLTGSRRAHG
jgi:hypothetical protein